MTPTVDIAELRAELERKSRALAVEIGYVIGDLVSVQYSALNMEEHHIGSDSMCEFLSRIVLELTPLALDAKDMQELVRRRNDAQDAIKQVAS